MECPDEEHDEFAEENLTVAFCDGGTGGCLDLTIW